MSRGMAVAIVMAACAHGHPLPITIGPAHELLVPVVVNGQELELQLDTGASTTTITPAAGERRDVQADGSCVPSAGAAGRIANVERTIISAELATFGVKDLRAAVIALDNGGVSDGLLGMDVLRYFVSDVDLAHHRLVLYGRGDVSWRTPDLVGVPYTELENGQVELAVVLDGRDATAILDLGANQSFANQLAAPARDDVARMLTATVGADGHPWQFRAFGDIALRVGDVPLVVPTLLVGDLPIFRELGLASRPAIIIGADLLASRRVVIDPTHHRVYLSTLAGGVAWAPLEPPVDRLEVNRRPRDFTSLRASTVTRGERFDTRGDYADAGIDTAK